ncbi:hypothetical protein [Humisphaera borealis]|uniref:Uncharacterized protein n=1 Tax=Humisphaera borealis TaxID=2807512 RepID=A0A7M2WZN5_9BACT|nr:hypothetical protein [Humisphaera borealis]QOV90935.1 hypothetical protein IPV69_06120 [Humisphaera borealis]
MREIGSTEVAGTRYTAVWAMLCAIDRDTYPKSTALALAVRSADGRNEAIIRRNARLADVEAALQRLRDLGFKDPQLSALFAHKGKDISQHVKVLVSRLN